MHHKPKNTYAYNFRRLLILLISFFLLQASAYAQDSKAIIRRIDSLAALGLPKSALTETERLERAADVEKDVTLQLAAAIYRMRFMSLTEESPLPAIVDRLKQKLRDARFPVKQILHSMLGNIYWKYCQQKRPSLYSYPDLNPAGTDITKWGHRNFYDEMGKEFALSLTDQTIAQRTPVDKFADLLEGDSATRYLRPTLYDLLVARALDLYLMDNGYFPRPLKPFDTTDDRFWADSKGFTAFTIPTTDTNSNVYKGFVLLQQATAFHMVQNHPEAIADLDLKRLVFLKQHTRHPNKPQLYLKGLEIIAAKTDLRSSADALQLMGKFYADNGDLTKAVSCYYAAIKRFPNSLAAKNAAGYLNIIKRLWMQIETENPNVSGKPLLGAISYTNIKAVTLSYYKLTPEQLSVYNKLAPDESWSFYKQPQYLKQKYIQGIKSLREQTIELPDLQDYKTHRTEFKIDPLEKGHYIIAARYISAQDTGYPSLFELHITDINYLVRELPDSKIGIVVAHRLTGKPMAGATVIADSVKRYTADKNGMVTLDVDHRNYSIKILAGSDSVISAKKYTYGARLSNLQKREVRTVFFTDRDLYRPGQTVYFSGLYSQTQGGNTSVIPGQRLSVKIKKNYITVIDSIPVVTNEFGTFYGSFVIPTNINGNIIFSTDQNNERDIRVEEYKRPTFEVELDPITKTYRPADSIRITGTVRAFAGHGISQARVAINVGWQLKAKTFSLDQKLKNILFDQRAFQLNDTVVTDGRGRFTYKFMAERGNGFDQGDVSYIYNVIASATDGNNETRKGTASVVAADNNVTLLPERRQRNVYFKGDTTIFKILLADLSGMPVKGKLNATIYALQKPPERPKEKFWYYDHADTFLIDSLPYQKNFPGYTYRSQNRTLVQRIDRAVGTAAAVADTLHSAELDLSVLDRLGSGKYRLVVKGETLAGDTATYTTDVIWYNGPTVPTDLYWIAAIPSKDPVANYQRYYVGNVKKSYVLIEVYDGPVLRSAEWRHLPAGKQQVIDIPTSYQGRGLSVQFMMMYDNRVDYVYFPAHKPLPEKLDIRFTTFRNKLQPGEKEQWKFQLRAKDNKIVPAQMVATLYDSALDGLRQSWDRNSWLVKNAEAERLPQYFAWERSGDNNHTTGSYLSTFTQPFYGFSRDHERFKMFSYNYHDNRPAAITPKTIKVNGKEVALPAYALREGYIEDSNDIFNDPALQDSYTMHETAVYNNYVTRRELSTPPGERFKTDALTYSTNEVTLRYINPRINFNETAFFYPELRTNKDGQISINFTMPQSLTQWRFKAFAHTRDLATVYVEQNIVTQKQLSVSAGMPRFFRSGDTITVAARVANLTSAKLKGRVQMQFFNGLNDQPIGIFADPKASEHPFELESQSNRSLNFKLIIPDGLDALTYRISAESGDFTDAEENTLPVLSKQVLVTTSLPMMVRPGERKSFTMDALAAKHSPTLKSRTLTLEYTTNTAWSAIQALPTLTDAADDSPEQMFGRYVGNGMAAHLISKQPVIKQIFDRWRSAGSNASLSNLEKNKELKTALLEESPWLRDAQTETGQKKRLALLFDVNQMSYDRQSTLNKLAAKQLADGGFAWFGGNVADSYITRYILAGIGQLNKAGATDEANKQALKTIADKAIKYSDTLLVRGIKDKRKTIDGVSPDELYAWYVRSYFADVPMGPEQKTILAERLKLADRQWLGKSKYEQGLIALTMLRNGKPEVTQKIVRSLMEAAQTSADMGMYWVDNRAGYYWYQAPIETQCLMIELFSEVGGYDKAIDEMKLWLIRNKQVNSWRSTKATAAACFALLINRTTALNTQADSKISIGGAELTALKPDIKAEAGTGYLKTTWTDGQIKPAMAKVDISNPGKSVGLGALYWQYLEDADKVKASQSGLQLERKYFIVTKDGPVVVDAKHQPKPGDLLKVVLYVKTDRDMEYIHVKDNRPAGTDPVDVLSAYKYQGGLYYYMVTRDLSTNFYISRLTKGNHVFEYEVRAAQPGNYSAGLSTIQSMYAPEFNATVGGQRVNVVAK
ncbi:alpha-2-macroglobulin family protein [Mucilaginibacter myungsuensis]|uniref:Alpha-2-macroglobulin domain-containing protein n=1 Tax=Mucilaginibacter myungsuensis TaxID=649104 RepID=A0A929KY90_9SPHI|nr:alpha-2-macroglobulin family protein [Mucilaginibacter myungsuensis]MBE9663879.1 hypothetical protein [Mucilaginibacter myungsuensis]MDN3598405.1 alpha-2-macroglobulin family protein [Mucilaginibacter myungsuensis]